MKTTEKLKTRLRASWRIMLVSLLRVTSRVQAGLEARVQRLPAR
jgi:hypothetical protein